MLTVTMGTGVLSPRPGRPMLPPTTRIAKWAGAGNPGDPQKYPACIASAEKLGALLALLLPGVGGGQNPRKYGGGRKIGTEFATGPSWQKGWTAVPLSTPSAAEGGGRGHRSQGDCRPGALGTRETVPACLSATPTASVADP